MLNNASNYVASFCNALRWDGLDVHGFAVLLLVLFSLSILTEILIAIHDRKKVFVRFYSKADSGVLDRVCAPMDYGPGGEIKDGLNRYWLWDYSSDTSSHTLGLAPQQIVDLQVLGEVFDPAQFNIGPSPVSVSQPSGLPPATVAASGGATVGKS